MRDDARRARTHVRSVWVACGWASALSLMTCFVAHLVARGCARLRCGDRTHDVSHYASCQRTRGRAREKNNRARPPTAAPLALRADSGYRLDYRVYPHAAAGACCLGLATHDWRGDCPRAAAARAGPPAGAAAGARVVRGRAARTGRAPTALRRPWPAVARSVCPPRHNYTHTRPRQPRGRDGALSRSPHHRQPTKHAHTKPGEGADQRATLERSRPPTPSSALLSPPGPPIPLSMGGRLRK